ncbi:hypothetical protein [Luteimicrobium subarcticum]|uniref:GIY-YIG catalytic domain-containing protein n=1 Tax=Luteimicrobium subarcticum TaxID=620910 RepID=A0A2M8W6U2_9MICO|nr:hypothetical protein [Luteimicrobium subarcticum]PJI86655.1 hypothetical protein CLV34_2575 [Luteimicrobium subarcticum]
MSTTPVNVPIPSDAEAPVIADFVEHALRVAYVNRAHLSSLPAGDWDAPGVYVLLTGDGSGRVYVGRARRLRGRLFQHNTKEPLPWRRAVAVKRDTTDGFNTAEIGYLEGRVSAEVAALDNLTVVEGRSSGDETLPKHMMISLGSFVKSILGALRLAGVDTIRSNPETEPEDQTPRRGVIGRTGLVPCQVQQPRVERARPGRGDPPPEARTHGRDRERHGRRGDRRPRRRVQVAERCRCEGSGASVLERMDDLARRYARRPDARLDPAPVALATVWGPPEMTARSRRRHARARQEAP